MKRFTLLSLTCLALSFMAMAQNQNVIVDDVYFNSKNSGITQTNNSDKSSGNQIISSKPRANYKNGAKEIIFKERKVTNPTIIRDTVYVVGHAGDNKPNTMPTEFDIANYDGQTNPVILHDTIYVSEFITDSINTNDQNQGYYLNGFNGSETDKEYAERIRRFHNPRYSIFIGDPRYNDIYFLNNFDWNVYVDGSYAYVTPTWTNPYWWNYNLSPMGFGGYGYGWNSPYGFGGMYNPWGYNSFYGYSGMYGYGNYWDPYGYGGYGYGGYYGNYYGYGNGGFSYKNKNYDEGTRRSANNYGNQDNRLGGTRNSTSAASTIAGGSYNGQSRNQYTVVSNSRTNTSNSGVVTRGSINSNTRTISGQAAGTGAVRSTFSRGTSNNLNVNTSGRSSNNYVNTQPRTYTTTINNVPTGGGNASRENYSSGTSSNRGSSTTIIRSSSNNSGSSVSPSRESYSGGSRSSSPTYTPSPSPSYSTGNSGGSSSSGSSSGGGGGSRSSGSSGGRR